MTRKVTSTTERRGKRISRRSNAALLPDAYEIFVEDSEINRSKQTQAGLLELTLWPPHQGERGADFPLWCDLRFECLEESYDDKWRIRVYLTRAELIVDFVGCRPARGTLYGDNLLPPDDTAIEQESKETDIEGSAGFEAQLGVAAANGLLAGLKGYIRRIQKSRIRRASTLNSKVKHSRVANVPARGPGKVWQIKDPRGRALRGTFLRAPKEDQPKEPPLCKIVPQESPFELRLKVEACPSDIGFKLTTIDNAWVFPWRQESRPNAEAVIKCLISKAFVEDATHQTDGRHRLLSARLWGRRKMEEERGVE